LELLRVRADDSPVAGRLRMTATVRYETGERPDEEYWIDIPDRYASGLSASGNCWLAFLLPLGAAVGEPVRIPLPIDATLLANAHRLMAVWRGWYPALRVVPVEAEAGELAGSQGDRTGVFFSGGVDSFFTLLRRRDTATPNERRPIHDLVTVHGFDVPLSKRAEFERMRARHQRVADEVGAELIDVATNLRETRWSAANWSSLAHGAGMAGIGLALERRFDTVYIASGGGYRGNGLHPHGSHPVTDPLFSTRHTAIVYDAIEYLRTEKIELIAESPVVHDALHVCWELENDENCGVCNKCLRTMLAFEVCGALSRCRTFPSVPLLERIAMMDCTHYIDSREFEDIRTLALARGRQDVVAAIDRSVRRTRWLNRLRRPARWARGVARRLTRREATRLLSPLPRHRA
jgi:hypothetical protein